MAYDLGSDHSAYLLVLSSAAFLIYLWIQLLLLFYLRLVGYNEDGELNTNQMYQSIEAEEFELGDISDEETQETPSDVNRFTD